MSKSSEVKWPRGRLGDHATVKARLGWKGLKADEYVDDGPIFLAAPNLRRGRIDFDNVDHITQWRFDESPEIQLKESDVLLVKDGSTLGISSFVRWLPGPTTVNGSIAVVRPNTSLEGGYLFYCINGREFQKLIWLKRAGLGVPHLFQADLREFQISLPTRSEQRRIAEILTMVDEAMEHTEALVGKLEQMKAGLMHDLFTRGVTPDGHLRPTRQEAPHLYRQTPLGWLPKEWEVRPFRSVLSANLQNGYFKKPELVGRGYKLVNVSELYQPLGIDTDDADVERVDASPADFQRYGVVEGDLFFTRSSLVLTGIAHCNVMLKPHEPTLFECHVIRAKPNLREADPAFLGLYFQTASARRELMARAKHTTMTTISQPDILAVPILKPSLDEQKRISKSIAANMSAIHAEESLLAKLRQQKQGLMQDLLTGRVPVKA
jgi:type I restriction enzyme, S subunit